MNAEHATPDSHAAYGSPGTAIRNARARAGLSLEELASRTRLAKPTLEAMESDAFDQLLEPVYVRGYYRKCARILEIPEQPLIDAYDRMYTPPAKTPPQRLRLASGGDLGSSPKMSFRFAILAPIVVIVFISVLWMLRQASPPTVPSPSVSMIEPGIDSAIAPPATTTPADPTMLPTDPAPTPATPASPTDPAAVAAPVDPAAAAAVTPAEAPPAPAAPVGTQLVLDFESISWARVEDSTGKSLLSGVISAGEKQTLDGKPPYSVFLGNAPGVKVQFGGQPVDLKPFVKGNSTARFTVPGAGN